MAEAKILRIYLDEKMLWQARQGGFGFGDRVTKAFEEQGFRVELRMNSFDERAKSGARRGYSMFLMEDPFHPKSLSMRKAYYFPFWRIEASVKRWEFEVAQKPFDPGEIDTVLAQNWVSKWRRYLFKRGPENATREGLVYVALQGRLSEHRSFQSMSPFDMIEEVRARAGDKRILLGLHPAEAYSDADHATLNAMAKADPRITIQTGGMEEALRICDLVVTQNSAAALSGFFYEKPAILFGQTDFHHAMVQVGSRTVDEAWQQAEETRPAYAEYLYWFIAENAIKADVEGEAEARIIDACRRHGWEI